MKQIRSFRLSGGVTDSQTPGVASVEGNEENKSGDFLSTVGEEIA